MSERDVQMPTKPQDASMVTVLERGATWPHSADQALRAFIAEATGFDGRDDEDTWDDMEDAYGNGIEVGEHGILTSHATVARRLLRRKPLEIDAALRALHGIRLVLLDVVAKHPETVNETLDAMRHLESIEKPLERLQRHGGTVLR
jgi:hypothetical protein